MRQYLDLAGDLARQVDSDLRAGGAPGDAIAAIDTIVGLGVDRRLDFFGFFEWTFSITQIVWKDGSSWTMHHLLPEERNAGMSSGDDHEMEGRSSP